MLHVLLYIVLCCVPALVLLPLRILDREPANEIAHESGDGEEREPDPADLDIRDDGPGPVLMAA